MKLTKISDFKDGMKVVHRYNEVGKSDCFGCIQVCKFENGGIRFYKSVENKSVYRNCSVRVGGYCHNSISWGHKTYNEIVTGVLEVGDS